MSDPNPLNINHAESREVFIQGGAYGEHNFVRVDQKSSVTPIDSKYFIVKLAPGAGSTLCVFCLLFCERLTDMFPPVSSASCSIEFVRH
jgi:hypothetical protein